MKIVVLSSRFPFPLEKGDKLRLYHQIRVLARQHDIFLISLSNEKTSQASLSHFEKMGVKVKAFKLSAFSKVLSVMAALMSNVPFEVALYSNNAIRRKVKNLVEVYNPDLVYCHLLRMAPYAEDLKAVKVIDYMDAFSYSMDRRAGLVPFPISTIYRIESQRMERYERKMAEKFDAHLIISAQDRSRFKFPGAKNFKIIPNGVEASYFTSSDRDISKKYDIGMIGNLGYLPNIEAARYIIRDIHPHLPDFKLLICGARPRKELMKLNSEKIDVVGWVDDIREAYRSIRIFVAPLFSGTGQQNKILESMAMGVPAITTPEVNEAIGAEEGKEILLASNPEEFLIQIKHLTANQDLYHEIRNNALTFVRSKYSWEDSVKRLSNIFESL